MIDRAQDMWKRAQDVLQLQTKVQLLQDGFRTTMRVVADLAESVGVPPSITSWLQPRNGEEAWTPTTTYQPSTTTPTWTPPQTTAATEVPPVAEEPITTEDTTVTVTATEAAAPKTGNGTKARTGTASTSSKRRAVEGDRERSSHVRPLEVEDAISGSTYLARIIWCLGVAQLEGLGPLRPADIARMVMSRSAVSLEPPNVARYIRRSKPNSIVIDHTEGSSSFYKLNAKGKKIFDEHFALS